MPIVSRKSMPSYSLKYMVKIVTGRWNKQVKIVTVMLKLVWLTPTLNWNASRINRNTKTSQNV